MDLKDYLDKQEKLYNTLLQFLEEEGETADIKPLLNIFKDFKIDDNNNCNFSSLLQMIAKISENHFRHPYFIQRVDTVLLHIKDQIKKTFKSTEIYEIFKGNFLILLYLYKKEIFLFDEEFSSYITQLFEKDDDIALRFALFMYPEAKHFLNKEYQYIAYNYLIEIDKNIFANFDEFRKKGENNFELCEMIRKDLVEEFVTYVNQSILPLSSKIQNSVFETNSLLIEKQASLIEYAAFFGSFQIFQYLYMSKVKLEPSLWIYAIHGKNVDIIHFLEENHIELPYKPFEESIKCHHNEISDYFLANYTHQDIEKGFLDEIVLIYCIHYRNFAYVNDHFDPQLSFFFACKFNYKELVVLLLESKKIDINETYESSIDEIHVKKYLNGILFSKF